MDKLFHYFKFDGNKNLFHDFHILYQSIFGRFSTSSQYPFKNLIQSNFFRYYFSTCYVKYNGKHKICTHEVDVRKCRKLEELGITRPYVVQNYIKECSVNHTQITPKCVHMTKSLPIYLYKNNNTLPVLCKVNSKAWVIGKLFGNYFWCLLCQRLKMI